MKRFVFSISLVLFASALLAQAPQAINYQAVARDAAGNLIANQAISFRLTILQGGPTGTVVYSETHQETSNQFGLVTMEIGWGTVISGVFANISWGTGTYFLKTEMDPAGGTAYQEMGTSQFISVPYAFWADTAQYARDGIPGPPGPPGPGTSCGMDVCYDGHNPGTGAGRIITADAGPIDVTVPAISWGPGVLAVTNALPPFWGQSGAITGISNTNSNGGEFSNTADGHAGYFYNSGTGLALESVADNSTAILAESNEAGPTLAAGVRAIGNGAAENAASLTLDNGAVRVAGNSRAAGKVITGTGWINDPWSRPGGDGHTHQTGYYTNITINNDLIIPESFIQLTVQRITQHLYCHYFAHIENISTGSVSVVVTCVGDTQPPNAVYVHYWIVNPEPEIP